MRYYSYTLQTSNDAMSEHCEYLSNGPGGPWLALQMPTEQREQRPCAADQPLLSRCFFAVIAAVISLFFNALKSQKYLNNSILGDIFGFRSRLPVKIDRIRVGAAQQHGDALILRWLIASGQQRGEGGCATGF